MNPTYKELVEALRGSKERLSLIARSGCLHEEAALCRNVEFDFEEYCHPCQAQDALSKINPILERVEG